MWRRGRKNTTVRVRSLSVHGLRIESHETVAPNYLIELLLLVPGAPISILAVTRNPGPDGFGASIHAIDPADHWRLAEYCRGLREQPGAEEIQIGA